MSAARIIYPPMSGRDRRHFSRELHKGERVNISKAERNELKGILATLADDWRASAEAKVTALRTNRKSQAAS